MSDKSKIEWTEATWPVVAGCEKHSGGCANCYAIRNSWRLAHHPNPKVSVPFIGTVEKRSADNLAWTGIVRSLPERLDWPLKWRRPRRIFVCNMSDLFHEAVSDEFIDRVFAVMALCPQHTFQVLTKRPERMLDWFQTDPYDRILRAADILRAELPGRSLPQRVGVSDPNRFPYRNVWLGVTAENQEAADERIPLLLQTPAAVRFVSVEPMLGPISPLVPFDGAFVNALRGARPGIPRLDWVICGTESGPKRRETDIEWVRSLRDQAVSAGVPFFLKQLHINGKKLGTPELDGRTWEEMPG